MATELRRRVREGLSLTCSCGVAPNRMLAKICSDLNKPDGQMVLQTHPTQLAQFVSTLPVRKVPGIGRVRPPLVHCPLYEHRCQHAGRPALNQSASPPVILAGLGREWRGQACSLATEATGLWLITGDAGG